MIVAVDRQKRAWLLNKNCSASIICVSFSSSSTTQDSLFENTSSVWAETTREKKNNENAAIKSHKRASQTGNCGSVLVCNVKKGTLELKKRHWKLYLHQILQVVCFSGFMENFVDAESKFSSHLTKLFLARATGALQEQKSR